MKTLGEVLGLSAEYLSRQGILRARLVAEELLSHVLFLKRLDLYLQYDRPMEEKELASLRELMQRKARGEPLEYLLGEVEFYGCHLSVLSGVLIPRPETELLVERICHILKAEREGVPQVENKIMWDICCGSGAIGLALKKTFPDLSVSLSDLSQEAVKIARNNALKNELEVTLYNGDLLIPFKGQKADYVVCNPPYVTSQEYLHLSKEISDYEPKMALVAGDTGLEFYQRLSNELPEYLNPQAKVFFEIGTGQGQHLMEIFNHKYWKTKSFDKDLAGHDRFFLLEIH